MSSLYYRTESTNSNLSDSALPVYSSLPTNGDTSLDFPQFQIVKSPSRSLNTWNITNQYNLPLFRASFANKTTGVLVDLTNLSTGSIQQTSKLSRSFLLDLPYTKSSVEIQLPTLLRSSCRAHVQCPEGETVYHWQFCSLDKWHLIRKSAPLECLALYFVNNRGPNLGEVQFHHVLPYTHAQLLTLAIAFIRQNF